MPLLDSKHETEEFVKLLDNGFYRDDMKEGRRMSELKPCPFCGEQPTVVIRKGKDGWRNRYAVLCDYRYGGCGVEGPHYHTEAEAVEAWNRRVSAERCQPGVAVDVWEDEADEG